MAVRFFSSSPLFRALTVALVVGCAPSLETGCKSDDDCSPGICSAGTCAPRPDADVTADASERDTGGGRPVPPDAEVPGPEADATGPIPDADRPDEGLPIGGGFVKPDARVGGAGGDGGSGGEGGSGGADAGAEVSPDATVTVTCEGAGEICDNGLQGVCRAFGVNECQPDGSLACSAQRVFGSAEVCDGLDNDCNGPVDDGVSIWCFEANPSLDGRGVCRAGYRSCVNGVAGDECRDQVLPSDEVCNGLDDDCDGELDENLEAVPCVPEDLGDEIATAVADQVGVCRPGTRSCSDGDPGECLGAVLPAAVDDCNGVDDDCDRVIDEDCACVQGETCGDVLPEPCSQGTLDCSRPLGEQCVGIVLPALEACNAVDDDCNGLVDDLPAVPCYDGPAGTQGQGVCRAGTRACEDGFPGDTCEGQTLPLPEVCNGLDDDCDGSTDEDFIGLGQPCAVGVGACLVESFGRCGDDGDSVICPVSPGGPAAETCDDVDNDCDGEVDENTDLSCYSGPEPIRGQCRRGVRRCLDGQFGACEGEVLPAAAEVCDAGGADENCNGLFNEGCGCEPGTTSACGANMMPAGVCRNGTSTCGANGQPGPCEGAVGPSAERCNDLDDDCDGETDEGGLIEDCYPGEDASQIGIGVCRSGTATCVDGEFEGCLGAVLPVREVCNGLDDDCDGRTDEEVRGGNEPCNTGLPGACAEGVTTCNGASGLGCEPLSDPSPESCNGRDDNCDGVVDNSPVPYIAPLVVDPQVTPWPANTGIDGALAWSADARRYGAATIHNAGNGLVTVRVRTVDGQGNLTGPVDLTQPVSQGVLRQVRIAALPTVNQLNRAAFVVAWLESPGIGQPVLKLQTVSDNGVAINLPSVLPPDSPNDAWFDFDMITAGDALVVFGSRGSGALPAGSERTLEVVRLSFDGVVRWRQFLQGQDITRDARDVAVAWTSSEGTAYYGLVWTHFGVAAPSTAYFAYVREGVDRITWSAPARLAGGGGNVVRTAQSVLARTDGFLTAFTEGALSTSLVIRKFRFDGTVVTFVDAAGRFQSYTSAATGDRTKSGAVLTSLPNQDVGVYWRELNNVNGAAASLKFRRANGSVGWMSDTGIVVTPIGQATAGPAVAREGLGVLYQTQDIVIPAPLPAPAVVARMFDGEVFCTVPDDR